MTGSTKNPEIGSTLTVNAVTTNYHEAGAGPPVLLIHGSGPGVSAWGNWREVIPVLAQQFHVLAPDLPGFGYTDRRQDATYSPAEWTRHLLAFLDAVGIERVSVVGSSLGGALALRLASQAPDRIKRLVLLGSIGAPMQLTIGLETVWGFEPSLPAMRTLLETLAYDSSHVSDELAALRLRAATRPGVQESYRSIFPAPRQDVLDGLTMVDAVIRALPQPTLIIHGREDHVVPAAASLRLFELIDNAQLHLFGHCGHWIHAEQRDRFLTLTRDFLLEDK